MVPENFIVDGTDLKNVPLCVAGYIRSYGFFNNEIFDGRKKELIDFINNNTKWELEYMYEDKDCSALCHCCQPELNEMLCDAFNFEDNPEHVFELIVVTSFSQITRSKKILKFLFEDDTKITIPIYCIDTGKVITSDPQGFATYLKDMTDIYEEENDK